MSKPQEFNTQNLELHTHKIVMSDHAYQRAAERFKKKNKIEALGYFRNLLRQAKRIGKVYSEDKKPAILYVINKISIYLSEDLTTIITVNIHDEFTYKPLKTKIIELTSKEFQKLDRLERSKLRKLHIFKLEANVEIARLNLQMETTKSEKIKNECQNKIKLINDLIKQKEEELDNIISAKRQIAKSLASLL